MAECVQAKVIVLICYQTCSNPRSAQADYREGREDQQGESAGESIMDRIEALVEDQMDDLEEQLVSGIKEVLSADTQQGLRKREEAAMMCK